MAATLDGGAKRSSSARMVQFLSECSELTLCRYRKTVTRQYIQMSHTAKACSDARSTFWLVFVLLFCTPDSSMSSDGLQKSMHLPAYHEKQQTTHSVLDIPFPDGLEAFKALRTFRILTKTTQNEHPSPSPSPEQNMPVSSLQQAIPHYPFAKVGRPAFSDKDAGKASQASEGAGGCLSCEGIKNMYKKFPSSSMITTTAASGGAIQANIQSLNVLFSQDATIDSSQTSVQPSHMPPAYETRPMHLPSVAIDPLLLEWGERQLYSPGILSFTVKNTCNSSFLNVFQIYSSDVQFYSFSFLESTLDPGAKLQIDVTFLPRNLGSAEAMLVLETSAGGFLIPAQGFGIVSPYILPQLIPVSLEEGDEIKQNLTLHNPFDKAMEVKEILAWPVDPTNGKLHLFCGGIEAEDACGEIDRRIKPSCIKSIDHMGDDRCCFLEPTIDQSGCKSSSVGLSTYIKLRPLESWKIEAHESSQVAAFEIFLKSNKSWTAQFQVRLANPSTENNDEIIIIPMELRWQRANNVKSKTQSKAQFPVILQQTMQTADAQPTGNGELQVELVQEELPDGKEHACSLKDGNFLTENTMPIETHGCKRLDDKLTKEIHDGMQGEIERGSSANLTLFENDVPIKTVTLPSAARKPKVTTLKRVLFHLQLIFGSKDRRSHVVSAKNTGSSLVEVYSVQIINGTTSADGLDVCGPQQFSLKSGQSSELIIYYRLEHIAAENDIQLQVVTSAGKIKIPIMVSSSNNPLHRNVYMDLYSNYETMILQVSVFALILVLISFSRMLMREIFHGKHFEPISPTDGAKNSTNQKGQLPPSFSSSDILMSPTTKPPLDHITQPSSPSISCLRFSEALCGSFQNKQKGRIISFKGVKSAASSLALMMRSSFPSGKSGSKYVTSPPKIPRIRVKSDISASSFVKSSKERASTTARKGAEKKQSACPSENYVNPTGSIEAPTKLTTSVIRRSSHVHSRSLTGFQDKLSVSPRAPSPRDNRAQDLVRSAQLHLSDQGTAGDSLEKDKGKCKAIGPSNLGAVKQEKSKSRSGSSCSASSPASPATTPLSPSRPISPLFHSESDSKLSREKRNSGAFNRTWSKTLKAPQPRSPLQSKHNNAIGSSHSSANAFLHGSEVEVVSTSLVPGTPHITHIHDGALELALTQNWESNLTETNLQTAFTEIGGASKAQGLPSPITFKEVLRCSVAATEANKQPDISRESEQGSRKHKGGATLTSSATFPQRGRDLGRRLLPVEDKVLEVPHQFLTNQNAHPLLTAPLVDRSDRAPGSRVARSYYQHVLGTLSPLQRNVKLCDRQWLGCDFQENCSCCGRASADGSESSSSNPDGDMEQVSSNLEYDIWGNHFADISRHSALQHRSTTSFIQADRCVESLANETSSLFSTSSHHMLQKGVNNQVFKSNSSSEFSMFTGKSFAEIPCVESSSKFNLPSAEDVTFASVENLHPTRYVIPQKRNCW